LLAVAKQALGAARPQLVQKRPTLRPPTLLLLSYAFLVFHRSYFPSLGGHFRRSRGPRYSQLGAAHGRGARAHHC
jgi:hypothetical protein